ncbi:MAG: 50S ribosomal protein L6 [Patescibacteria group bacterium]
MSRIGARPIKIPEGVNVQTTGSGVVISSGENVLEVPVHPKLAITVAGDNIVVNRADSSNEAKSLHGLTARLIANAVAGVKSEFKKDLEFSGTGYRAAVSGQELILNMGYSHEIRLPIPGDLKVTVAKNTISITGKRKELVGNFAATVRDVRPPEVYKGKGIKYKGELIRRKAGKTAASK